MKNTVFALMVLGVFVLATLFLFGIQWGIAQQNILELNYKTHILIAFMTALTIITMLVLFILGKKNILGFVFLGFVIFKFFAMGYIAVFQKDFKTHLIPYFVVYWLYLLIEVVFVLKLIKKQD